VPGLRELARIFLRLSRRLRLVGQRRKLARLESHLGLLGWQQADYDHGTQQHVNQLTDYERAQVQFTNDSADIGLAIRKLEEQKSSEQTTFEQQREQFTVARDRLTGPVTEAEQALAAQQREVAELEARTAALDREIGVAEQKYRGLLAKGVSAEEAEVVRLQQRVILIPREKQECEASLMTARLPLARLENELQQHRALLAVEVDGLRALEKAFAESGGKLAREISTRKREKQKLERQIDALEKSKVQPYREIGRALADQGIEPVNQPEALTAVLEQRAEIAAAQTWIADSLAASARENRRQVWGAWLLLFVVGAALAIGLCLVWRGK